MQTDGSLQKKLIPLATFMGEKKTHTTKETGQDGTHTYEEPTLRCYRIPGEVSATRKGSATEANTELSLAARRSAGVINAMRGKAHFSHTQKTDQTCVAFTSRAELAEHSVQERGPG